MERQEVAFDRAWGLVKMPYYHGTSSANLESILEHGLLPSDVREGNWPSWMGETPYDDEEGEPQPASFMAEEPFKALAYAMGNISEPSNEIGRQTPDNRPVVIEISDDAEGIEGFDFNPTFHDFKVRGEIPPEMLRLVHEGDNYPDVDSLYFDNDMDIDEAQKRHQRMGEEYETQQKDKLTDSDWFKQYMAMGDKRHPPFVLREGLY